MLTPRSLHPKADYSRLCVDCVHKSDAKTLVPMCEVSVDLVTGKPIRVPCLDQRSAKSACGPEGRRWECEASPATAKPKLAAVA